MPSCKKCGSYTKYFNGLCYDCYSSKKSKSGKVYLAKVTFPSGKNTIYTGQTRRSVYDRIGEHKNYQYNGERKHYTGRGVKIDLLGSIYSKNRFKAERTIKGLPREDKIKMAKRGARGFFRSLFG